MLNILVNKESDLKVDIEKIVENMNAFCQGINFSISQNEFYLDNEILYHPASLKKLDIKLLEEIQNYDRAFLFTRKAYIDNYFIHKHKKISMISFFGWNQLTDLSLNNGAVYFIIDILALILDNSFRHEKTTGCVYDFLWDKRGVDDGMRQAYICQDCLSRISKLKLNSSKQSVFDCIRKVMNDLSSASKWNMDIIDYWESQLPKQNPIVENASIFTKKKVKKENEIHVLIASPSDTVIERQHLLDHLEREFRLKHESNCNHRLIVHGWEDLPTQTGHTQTLINEYLTKNVDIIIAIFKHRLGSPVKDPVSNEVRADAGTVEEILYAIDNKEIANPPLGMIYFHSTAPSPSFDSADYKDIYEQWEKLKKFKKSIEQKILYKSYTTSEDLFNIAGSDLALNIENYFC
ncbi:MAG: hypothetical protein GY855_02590 [candidate division Zixibacteria bacterium]|nr:hypothetical protein [candidate division Zixibacteria bacterium]